MTTTAATDFNWRDHAACVGMDVDVFFSEGNVVHPDARAACARCPVQAQCLAEALSYDDFDDHGFWGGTTKAERRSMRDRTPRGPRPISHGTEGGWRTHKRRGEEPCDPCWKANAAAKQRRRANKTRLALVGG